jgi:hypothetical protein
MLHKLKNEDYGRVMPLIKDISHSRALVFSVIEGNAQGSVFVDNIEEPRTAYIEGEFSYLVGYENNSSFNNDIYNYIFNEKISKSKDEELVLFLFSESWLEIRSLLKERGCIDIQRKTFNFNVKKFKESKDNRINLTEGFDIVKITEEFVNKYQKHQEIIQFPSRFGFCIVNEKEIVSECISVAVGAGEVEIGVNTNEMYSHKGYATKVCSEFIDYCIEKDIWPNWSCWPFRKESINLAGKLGFEEKESVPAIYWSHDM